MSRRRSAEEPFEETEAIPSQRLHHCVVEVVLLLNAVEEVGPRSRWRRRARPRPNVSRIANGTAASWRKSGFVGVDVR